MPDWVNHAVLWQIYPLGFLGAEAVADDGHGVVHRLARIEAWLDYAVELGVSGLLLGPIFSSSSHGYDTADYFSIDGRLGDESDFDALVEACHRRGLKIVLDGVFNHVGREFGGFREVLANGSRASSAAWFHLTWPAGDAPGTEPDYATFEGHRELVALNHAEPEVARLVADVMKHWLRRGADGWRLDAAYAVPRGFWRNVLPQVRAEYPEAYFFGEVIHGDHAGFVRETGVDAVTQYELWKAIWSSLNDRNFFELAWSLERHNGLLESFVPQTFVGNHDVTRIASQLADERHLPHALVILLTCGGTPSIYAGDEQAFRGTKEHRAGGDDAIRPAFPPSSSELAPFGWPVYRLHQDLIGLRRRHPWLHRAHSRTAELRNTHFVFEAFREDHRLLIALNLADAPVNAVVPGNWDGLLGTASCRRISTSQTQLTLPPHGWGIFA